MSAGPAHNAEGYGPIVIACGLKYAKNPWNLLVPGIFVWRRHPDLNLGIRVLQTHALPLGYVAVYYMLCCSLHSITHRYKKCHMEYSIIPCDRWSGRRGSNPLPPPWQGGALPDELRPHMTVQRMIGLYWCLRSESNQRHEDFQSSALPTELQRHTVTHETYASWVVMATQNGLEPSTSSVTG